MTTDNKRMNNGATVKNIKKSDVVLFLGQVAVWMFIFGALPLATFLSTHDQEATSTSFQVVWSMFRAPMVVWFANFYVLGPYLFFRHRFWLFALCNLLLILGLNYGFFYVWLFRNDIAETAQMTSDMWIGYFTGFFMFLLLNCFVAAMAVGLRHLIRVRQIRQQLMVEKARNTEAELAWLKNQINPHFLFNTLNNISSLTQTDADAAQDAIAQLSDLLRYAMYETNKKTVPIGGEVDFMRNYISLMKLRCNDKAQISARFDISTPTTEIPPLLFISLIENAFKHGLSSSRPSTIDISLVQQADRLVFSCDNTNYPKDDTDRSGSGIGIENTRRRLDLLYKDRYRWEHTLQNNIYHVAITLLT